MLRQLSTMDLQIQRKSMYKKVEDLEEIIGELWLFYTTLVEIFLASKRSMMTSPVIEGILVNVEDK